MCSYKYLGRKLPVWNVDPWRWWRRWRQSRSTWGCTSGWFPSCETSSSSCKYKNIINQIRNTFKKSNWRERFYMKEPFPALEYSSLKCLFLKLIFRSLWPLRLLLSCNSAIQHSPAVSLYGRGWSEPFHHMIDPSPYFYVKDGFVESPPRPTYLLQNRWTVPLSKNYMYYALLFIL